jgi:nucleoside-diphosphate-sugar epimerase
MDKLKVIITGSTGMIGEGVLYECLRNEHVENVLVINRKPSGYSDPKLTEIIHDDFFDITSLTDRLTGYNACFFCIGSTAVGKSEDLYKKLTYTLTMNFAALLSSLNPDMIFCYISGAGTDSSEKGRAMWARVKGKTENDLMKLPFRNVYNFRPAAIEPFLPLKPSQTYYKTYRYMGWLFPTLKVIAPGYVIKLKDLAAAMINVALRGYKTNILEMKDIKSLAKRAE